MPQYLYNYHHFKETYEIPIIKNEDQQKQAKLKQLVEPFILRRTKKDVLTELPDKIENNVIIHFTPEEEKVYLANLSTINSELQSAIQVNHIDKIQILAMMTRLRQLCCDQRILYKDIIDNSSNNSTVFNAVLQNLVDQKFPVNDDMKEDAATIIKQIKSAYKSNYGDNYKDSLNQALTSAGYKNLSEYRQKMIKQIQYANFLLDYIDDHFDDVFNDYYQQCAPKYVSLIKISVSDTSSPTDDETSKLNEVKELISNTDKSFGDIAQDYSNDSTSSKKGSLGIVDSKDTSGIANSYGEDVFNAIKALSEGQVSDVITGDDGYYFVKVTSTDKKTLKKELKKTDIDSPLLAYDDYLQYVVYNSYKINYKDKDIKKIVQEVVNKALEERKTERGEA